MATPVIKVYTAADVLDDSVWTGGLVPIEEGPAPEYTVSAVGGCLGAQFTVSAGFTPDDYAIDRGQIVRIYDGAEVVYLGDVVDRERSLDGATHTYFCRGWWDRLKVADTSGYGEGTAYGADEDGDETTAEDIVETIWGDVIDALGIGWDAAKVDGAVEVDSFLMHEGSSVTEALVVAAEMCTTSSARMAVGVDAEGDLYFLPISTDSGDRQATMTVGGNLVAATEREPDNPPRRVVVGSRRVMPVGSPNAGWMPRKTFSDAALEAAAPTGYGRGKAWGVVMGDFIYQEADLTAAGTGWLARHGTTTRRFDRPVTVTGGAAAPVPWLGRGRYVDGGRTIDEDHYIRRVTVRLGNELEHEIELGDVDERTTTQEPYAPGVEARIFEAPGGGGTVLEGWPPYDVTDTTEPPDGAFRPGTETELGGGGGEGEGGLGVTRGQVMGSPAVSSAIYNSATSTGVRMQTVCKVANGGTALESNAVSIIYRRLDSSLAQVGVTTASAARQSTEDEEEIWSDAGAGYTPAAGDYAIQVGVRVQTASGPAVYEYWPEEGSSNPDWDDTPYIYVNDPAAGGYAILSEAIPVGFDVSP